MVGEHLYILWGAGNWEPGAYEDYRITIVADDWRRLKPLGGNSEDQEERERQWQLMITRGT